MKKCFVLGTFLVAFLLLASAFDDGAQAPRFIIQNRLNDRQAGLLDALQSLKSAAIAFEKGKANKASLQLAYLKARKAFKKWEYLAEYLDPVLFKDRINGAPLPKLERNSFGSNVMEPKGLQVLDELVFAAQPQKVATQITYQTGLLIDAVKTFNLPVYLYDKHVLEAARIEIVRVFNLGLTGFDTPGSGSSIEDAVTVFETMSEDLSLYQAMVRNKNTSLAKRIEEKLSTCIRYLRNNADFDKLDRLHLLKEFINPLYTDLLLAHAALELEMPHETQPFLPPFNYQSKNLFANDFLDPYKYSMLPPSLNNDELLKLGKTLFFDPVLSASGDRACAGCHNPAKAFTDGNEKSMATGMEGNVGRNAPTLINCVYNERFFHDMRAEALEDQIEHVIVSEKEFNTNIFGLSSRILESEEYRNMFLKAFTIYEVPTVNRQTIGFAISAYVMSLRGFNSPFDRYVRGETAQVDVSVKRGFNLFMGKAACGTCHFAPVFNGTVPPLYLETESEVLGVPENPYATRPVIDPDEGRAMAKLTENVPFYQFSFKTPTVRNVALTAPYMHNGAYKTLEDVMDFYNRGGGTGIGLKLEHQTLPGDSLHLSRQDISDVVAFMKSLTDTTGMTSIPERLPKYKQHADWDARQIGGKY